MKKRTQKIIIPKGTIDPNEDTLIEIPIDLKEKSVIVAQRQGDKGKWAAAERTSKNVDFGEHKDCELDDHTIINVSNEEEDNNKYFSPKHQSSLQNPLEFEVLDEPRPTENSVKPRSYEKMNAAKRELEESLFLTISQGQFDMTCSGTLLAESNKSINNPKQSSSCTSRCSDKSFQCNLSKLPSDVTSGTPKKRDEPFTTNIVYGLRSAVEEPPSFSSPKKKDCNYAMDAMRSGKITQDFSEQDDAQIKVEKGTSADYHDRNYSEASRPLGRSAPTDELTGRSANLLAKNISIECLRNRSKPVLRKQSSSSYIDELEDDQGKLNRFYKRSGSNLDDVYLDQLKRQFEEAKRKLEDAIMLASTSLKHLQSKHLCTISSGFDSRAAPICDCVPEKDISFIPASGSKESSVAEFGLRSAPISSVKDGSKASSGGAYRSSNAIKTVSQISAQKIPTSAESTSRSLMKSKDINKQKPFRQTVTNKNSVSSVSSKRSHSCSEKKTGSTVKISIETRCCGSQT